MSTALVIVALGLILGMRHATDPDHVVAVTTIVAREQSAAQAAIIGALWGVGHTITIFAVGSAIILFKLTIPTRLGLSMELAVACMLILLGVLNLTGVLQRAMTWLDAHGFGSGVHNHRILGRIITHAHQRLGRYASGENGLTTRRISSRFQKLGIFHVLRPVIVGLVHGLAGSAAVALLVLTTIRQPVWAIAYLLIFGLGTVIGMMLITAMISLPFLYTRKQYSHWNRGLAVASGFISLCFGLFLCYQIGFSDGLFTAHPHWIPR